MRRLRGKGLCGGWGGKNRCIWKGAVGEGVAWGVCSGRHVCACCSELRRHDR